MTGSPIALRPLGRTSVQVSTMGLGSAPLGGLFARVTDRQADATIVRALELGVRHIDTAPLYGQGLAEQRIGATLRRLRPPVTLSTKVGRVVVPGGADDGGVYKGGPPSRAVFDFSAGGIMRSLEDSLGRLGVDSVDILFIHDPDDHPDAALTDAYPTLAGLRRQGAVGAIGVGMNQTELLTRFVLETDVDCVMIAGRYTLLDQSAATMLLPACQARGVAVLVGGVYNSGILASSFSDDAAAVPMYDYQPAPAPLLERARRLAAACAARGVPLKAAALQFALAHPAVTSIVVGARSPVEVEENMAMLSWLIPHALWDDLRRAGLIGEDAATPTGA